MIDRSDHIDIYEGEHPVGGRCTRCNRLGVQFSVVRWRGGMPQMHDCCTRACAEAIKAGMEAKR